MKKTSGAVANPATVDFTDAFPPGATISSISPFVVTPSSGLFVSAPWSNGAQVQFQLGGGLAGTTYTIEIFVNDTNGNECDETVPVTIMP